MVWRTLGRLVLVPLAFLLATGVAGLILVTLGLEHMTRALHGKEAGVDTLNALLELVSKGSLLASGLTLLPALAVIIAGEVARVRSWLYYLIGGGLALAAVPLLARLGSTESAANLPAVVWQVLATSGFAGGLVYWLIAGRRA